MTGKADQRSSESSQVSVADATERDGRRFAVAIWTAVILTCLGLLGFTGWLTWQSRDRALEAARRNAGDTARLLEGRVTAIADAAELIINGVGRELIADARDEAAQARATHFLAGLSAQQSRDGAILAVRHVRALNPASGMVEFSAEVAGPTWLGREAAAIDAEAGQAHRDRGSIGLHVGAPVALQRTAGGPGPDCWIIGLSRRLNGGEGRSGLILVVHLSLERLQAGFADAGDLGQSGFVQLFRHDGRLLVGQPYRREIVGRDLSRAPLFTTHLGRAAIGDYLAPGTLDGVPRLFSYRRLPGLPLVLTAAVAEADALAGWRRDALGNGGLVLAASFSIAVLGGWLAWEARRRARAKGRLTEQARVLASTLENMDQGLMMVDANDVVQVCNARAVALLGLPTDLIARKPRFQEVLRHQIEAGEFEEDEASDLRRAIAAGGGVMTTRQTYDRVRPNGTVLEVRTVGLDGGGAVRTYTDVTARRAVKAALLDQNRRFDAALENMGQGLLMIDGAGRVTVVNRRFRELYGLSPDSVRPGTHARELVAESVRRGSNRPGETAKQSWAVWRARLAERKASVYDQRLPDGRRIAVVSTPADDGGWVVTYEDVSERVAVEEALRSQNRLFDAALANMAQGLCMFDAESRLVVRNDRYLDMMGLTSSEAPLGITHVALVERLVAGGRYEAPASAQAIYEGTHAKLATRDSSPLHRRLSDGRTVAIVHRVMPGGGWVATFEDVTERRAAEGRLAHMARHDALTGLPNRVELRDRMDVALASRPDRVEIPVLCIDLDRFKPVNDSLGHSVGDALLRAVADRIEAVLGSRGIVARLGGDEFAILGEASTSAVADAVALGARLVDAIGAPFEVEGHSIVVGASVGIAVAPGDGDGPDLLLRHADMALYRAKADGRGTYRTFEPAMEARARSRRALEIDLRGAMARHEFALEYQPLVTLAADPGVSADHVTGFEALLRWRHPERGAVPPSTFIPVAEEIALIAPLGEWVLRRACQDAAVHWPDPVAVAVNLSAVQFRRGQDIAQSVFAALAASGLRPGRLEIEITESVLLEETEATLATLHRLRSFGVRIALDDFGTGYSSLSYLRKFPFDKIKIDRSFVGEIGRAAPEGGGEGGNAAAIVRAVAALGQSLGMTTTAEGVETKAQLDAIRAQGCTEAQGYLFGPPRPLADAWPPGSTADRRGRRAA